MGAKERPPKDGEDCSCHLVRCGMMAEKGWFISRAQDVRNGLELLQEGNAEMTRGSSCLGVRDEAVAKSC
jgi:hypothetical protein